MGNLKGVDIQRGSIGANVLGNTDGISGLLVNAPAIVAGAGATGLAVGVTAKITKLSEAVARGITAAYDTANNVRVYRHISEFYRMAGDGNTLYVMLYTGTPAEALSNAIYAKKMLTDANGEIRQLALAYNPDLIYVPTYVNGLEENVHAAIAAAQTLYDWAWSKLFPCQILIEGRGYNAVNAAATIDLRTLTATKVSLCIGQDYKYAETQNAVGKKMADVGTLLGVLGAISVNRNVGEVATMNLTNPTKNLWVVAGLSNHKTIAEMDVDLEDLDTKGYIFPISFIGYAGIYWNNDHTCAAIIQDEDGNVNEYCIAYGRTHDKAVRQLYLALLPQVKSTQQVDKTSGKLPPGLVKYFEGLGDTALGKMERNKEISAGKTTIDADSNLLVIPRTLSVSFKIQPTGTIDLISGTINLQTSI